MSIDRIGKSGGPGPAPAASSLAPASDPASSFEVARNHPANAVAAAPPVAGSALDQLQSGKLDLEGYLGAKLDQATAHLQGLAPAHLEAIRSALREQLAIDPALADLVTQATGRAASAPED
jgi:hypothetical protein